MCGILGYWGRESIAASAFGDHLRRIRHRGPDHAAAAELDGLHLGHNRLAIIDLDPRSNQPMISQCGNVALVFNGEIYNYVELKKELAEFPFRTDSDTEVIIAAYLSWGERFVDRLLGMFSFALYDRRRRTVVLARDHVGKKPLYFSQSPLCFAFASEIKALLGLPGISGALDDAAVNEFFSSGFIGGSRTVYRDISQLPAGHLATFTLPIAGPPVITRFWRLPVQDPVEPFDEERAVDELDALLADAVRIRLRSDVPVGVFLSGGLDSSLIVALAARASSRPVRTFTISFAGTSNDESAHAERIANHFGTQHTVHDVNEDVLGAFPSLVSQLDQPFADSSFVPMFFVCREARKEVTVALSGDGGDELFAGYGHYDFFARENDIRARWPSSLRKLVGRGAAWLPDRQRSQTLRRLVFDDYRLSMGSHASRFFNFQERGPLLCGPIAAEPTPEREFLSRLLPGLEWLQNICQADFQGYMVDDILVKVDRMSMLNSLEVRSPLLDKRVAEFAFARVPSDMKRREGVKKYILKRLAGRYLPRNFQFERKHGFGVPLDLWFKGVLGDRLMERLSSAPSGYVDPERALGYLRLHRRGFSNVSKKLFAILIWEEWFANQRATACAA
jgi:asparagine synthase (glutamine-hydrolysing)